MALFEGETQKVEHLPAVSSPVKTLSSFNQAPSRFLQSASKVAEYFLPSVQQQTDNYGRNEEGWAVSQLISKGLITYVPRMRDDYHKYDLKNLRSWNTTKLLMFLVEYFPEMAKTIDTYLKVADTTFTFNVFAPDHSLSREGQEAIQGSLRKIDSSGVNNPGFNKVKRFNPFLREQLFNVLLGAACCESIFEAEVVTIGTINPVPVKKLVHKRFESVNPMTIKFGYNGIPYQTTATYGDDTELDIPTFFFEQNTGFVGYPYGRNQIVSIIRPALFKLELMEDIKMAVHRQGHPRIKVEVDSDTILEAAERISPEDVRTPEDKLKFIQAVLDAISLNASRLQPDSCIAHLASQKWSYLEMVHTGAGMFNPEKLIEQIDTQITSALQTFPTILGKSFAGNTEGYSSIESLLYLMWIGGNQRIVSEMMSAALTQILHKEHNIQGYVTCAFKQPKLRQNEEMAGFKANELNNIKFGWLSGSIDYDEMTRRVREVLDFTGDRPADAELMIDDFLNHKKEGQPQRDPSQEPGKEEKRKKTNEQKKSGGSADVDSNVAIADVA